MAGVAVPETMPLSFVDEHSRELQGSYGGMSGTLQRVAKVSVASLFTGLACGGVSHWLTGSGRVSLPVAAFSESESKQTPILDDGIYPVPFFIPGNRVCGAARCHPGDLCCPAAPGFGFACGARESVCCQGNRGSIVCAANGQCCRNSHGASYCCAEGNFCEAEVCVAQQGTHCFPGYASVTVKRGGRTRLEDVLLGDEVLVEHADDTLSYEPVLDFIHATRQAEADYLVVQHEHGELPVSANHIMFFSEAEHADRFDKPAARASAGDVLALPGHKVTSQVLSVRKETSTTGMFAPLTPSGRLVVDNVAASAYAVGALHASVAHASAHAGFFLTRVFAQLRQLYSRFWQHATVVLLQAAFVSSALLMSSRK
eukprot:TRINITY_DN619_c0_g1_i7.p1 TRINITY_DN619_c0_g1~~TRINITY_DN619_c0_g1_i7.p1  ORF type:complete len:371 (-),score=53.16 TRINITY_DN619_c0_g1_i7:17-1129(-)